MTLPGSKPGTPAATLAAPVDMTVPESFAALATVPSQEYDLQALLSADVDLLPLSSPAAKKGAAAVAAPAVAAAAAQAAGATGGIPGFAPMIELPFGLHADLDFTGSFLASSPSTTTAMAPAMSKSKLTPKALAGLGSSGSAVDAPSLFDEGSMASSDEWIDDYAGFDDQSMISLGELSTMDDRRGAMKRKQDGAGGDGAGPKKRPRHRPTVHIIRQRQQMQLDKLNTRNEELRTTIASVTSDLDQVKRLVCQLLKRKLASMDK